MGDWTFGVNLGAGMDFTIARRWDFLAGFKWLIQTHKDSKNPIIINAGFAYRF